MEIKGQTLADFIAEFTYSDTTKVARTTDNAEVVKELEIEKSKTSTRKYEDSNQYAEQWTLYVDDASNENRSGASIILICPKGHKIHCAMQTISALVWIENVTSPVHKLS